MGRKLDELYWDLTAKDRPLRDALRRSQRELRSFDGDAKKTLDRFGRRFDRAVGDAKEALARGLIDRKEFERQSKEAAKAFNKGILNEIEHLAKAGKLTDDRFIELSGSLKDVEKQGRKTFTGLQGWIKGVAGVAGIGLLLGGLQRGIQLAARFGRAVGEITQSIIETGGEERRIRENFQGLAASAGLDPSRTITELRRATRGMAEDITLFRSANRALQAELPVTEESLSELAFIARRLGEPIGLEGPEAFEKLAMGIAKFETEITKQVGILTTLRGALQEWEDQTGGNADELDKAAQVGIFFNAVMEEGRRKVAAMGRDSLDAGERLDQMAAFWGNLKSASAEAIADSPRIRDFFNTVGDSAENASAKVDRYSRHVGALTDVLAELAAQGGEAARPGGFLASLFAGTQLGRAVRGFAQGGRALFGDLYSEALDRRDAEAATEAREAELRSLKTVADARRELLANFAEEQQMRSDQVVDVERMNELLRERALILERLARLSGDDGDTGPTVPGDQVREAEATIEQQFETLERFRQVAAEAGIGLDDIYADMAARLQEMLEIEGEIAELERQREIVSESHKAQVDELLARKRELLQNSKDELDTLIESRQIMEKLPEPIVQLANSMKGIVDPFAGDLRNLAAQAENVAKAERELTRARIEGNALGIAEAEERLAEARERLRNMAAALAAQLREAGVDTKQLEAILKQLEAILAKAGVAVQSQTDDWADWFDTVRSAARGVLAVGDAMDVLGRRERKALEGAIDLAEGIQQVYEAVQLAEGGGQLAAGNIIGGSLQIIGGLARVLSSLMMPSSSSDRAEPTEAELEQVRITRENTQALRDLRHDIRALESAFGGVRLGEAAAIGSAIQQFLSTNAPDPSDQPGDGLGLGGLSFMELQMQLQQLGLTMADVEILAGQLGIEYGEHIDTLGELEAVLDAINQLNIDRLFNTFSGQLGLLRRELDLFDIDDPIEQLRRMRELFLTFSDLPEELANQLAGADITTEEGRRQLETLLQDLFERVASGAIDLSEFGGMTLDEFLQSILDLENLIDQADEATGTTQSYQVRRSITEVTGNRLLGELSTSNVHLDAIRDHVAAILDQITAPEPETSASPPSSAEVAAMAGGGDVHLTVEMGGIYVDGGDPDAGRRIGEDIIETVNEGLGDTLRDQRRAAGLPANPRAA